MVVIFNYLFQCQFLFVGCESMEGIRSSTNGTDLNLPTKSTEGSIDLSKVASLLLVICFSVILGVLRKKLN